MVCIFREPSETPPLIEVTTLREVDGSIEQRVRHFSPLLETWEGKAPLVFKSQTYSAAESTFVNVSSDAVARRVIVSRNGDVMTSRVEVVTQTGKTAYIEAKSRKVQ
jgi:hypothetical protein